VKSARRPLDVGLLAPATTGALLTTAALPAATLAALRTQFTELIIPIIEDAIAIPILWSFHGVLPFRHFSCR
jgi:hypothetical protein